MKFKTLMAAATLAAVAATVVLAVAAVGIATAIQASVESRVVAAAYARIDDGETELQNLEAEIRRIRDVLAVESPDSNRRDDLEERLLEAQARHELVHSDIRSLATAIIGFTFLSPDARAQQILHDDFLAEVRFYLEHGDDYRAQVALTQALDTYRQRNPLGFTEEDFAWLAARKAEVDMRVAARRRLQLQASESP